MCGSNQKECAGWGNEFALNKKVQLNVTTWCPLGVAICLFLFRWLRGSLGVGVEEGGE